MYHGGQLIPAVLRLILAWCLYFACVHLVAAAPPATYDLLQAIYRTDFSDYESKAADLRASDPDSYTLLQLFYWRWKEVPVAYSTVKESYYRLLGEELARLENIRESGPRTTYHKICLHFLLAEYHASLGNTWQALRQAQQVYPLIVEVFDRDYREPEFTFVRGIYHYYIEHYRQKNILFRAAFLPFRKGDKAEGLRLLRQSAAQKSMAQVEAKIFLTHILLRLENRPSEALFYSRDLLTRFPQNTKMTEMHAEVLIKNKMFLEAQPVVDQLATHSRFYYACPGHFFRGYVQEELHHDKDKARQAYEKCLNQPFKPVEDYQRQARQRLKLL